MRLYIIYIVRLRNQLQIGDGVIKMNNQTFSVIRCRAEENETTYHHLGDEMRLNHSNYHVINSSNKDW